MLDGPRPGWHLLVLPAGVSTQAGTIAAPAASSPPARRSNQLAILNDQLELHFQPLVNARTGAIHSGEALLRWHHPVNGVIPFRRFAHAARDDGRLPELGGWALRAACRAAQAWPSTQGRSPSVTVNIAISRSCMARSSRRSPPRSAKALSNPSAWSWHLDEQVLVAAEDEVAPILHALAALGVRLAIDDFGHGLSTIRRLKRYPIQALKLDPELVRQVGRLDESDAVVESIVCMARPLGLKVLARIFLVLRPQLINIAPEMQRMVTLELTATMVVAFILFSFTVGVIAGFMPAIFFSKVNPINALRNVSSVKVFKQIALRRVLVVIQYTVTLIFITATAVGYVQYKDILAFDLGFNTENILNIDMQGNKPDALIKELSEMPEVTGLSRSLIVTSVGNAWGGFMKSKIRAALHWS